MLSVIAEFCLALLASAGLAGVVLLAFSRWLFPTVGQEEVLLLIPARGAAHGLDQTLQAILLLRRWGLVGGRPVVVDCGLDEEGRALARLLCAYPGEVLLCRREDLSKLLL